MTANHAARLDAVIAGWPGVVVAYSGGVDSSVLLHAAVRVLGHAGVIAVTARSPSLAARELEAARRFASDLGVDHRVLDTHELSRDAYRRNDGDRCFHCKSELFDVIARELVGHTEDRGWPVAIGAIVDDLSDHRPGMRAARERGVRTPLADAGFDKLAVRDYARGFRLAIAEKPSSPCLASRVAYGIAVDAGLLARIERGEEVLRELGFSPVRLRHHGAIARIEVAPEALAHAVAARDSVLAALRPLGWTWITVDLAGHRSGSLNQALAP